MLSTEDSIQIIKLYLLKIARNWKYMQLKIASKCKCYLLKIVNNYDDGDDDDDDNDNDEDDDDNDDDDLKISYK